MSEDSHMIISVKREPTLDTDFANLMKQTNDWLNMDAKQNAAYYKERGGKALESDVCEAIKNKAIGTPFEGTVQLVSKNYFPDIIANKYFGVEVKSTQADKWVSTGSSILESTRNEDVERIYMTFGKLGGIPQFITKPYEECLSDIVVTHYPRYSINMNLEKGATIFDKMGVSYDELRKEKEPATKVIEYYRELARQGHSILWWMGTSQEDIERTVSPIIRFWIDLPSRDKNFVKSKGMALFPVVFQKSSPIKYRQIAEWLFHDENIINTNIRDMFSAGGQVTYSTRNFGFVKMPQIVKKSIESKDTIIRIIMQTNPEELKHYWGVPTISPNRIQDWMELAARNIASYGIDYYAAIEVLQAHFGLINYDEYRPTDNYGMVVAADN